MRMRRETMSSFDEDVKEMRREEVAHIIYAINRRKDYNDFKGKSGKQIREMVISCAKDDDGFFGEAYITIIEDALNRNDWAEIAKKI
jgi:hypothetical protein